MSDQQIIFRQQVKSIGNMFSRYQQQMQRCSRIDILYRYQLLVLIDRFGRDFTGDYFAEKTTHFHTSLTIQVFSGRPETLCSLSGQGAVIPLPRQPEDSDSRQESRLNL